MTKMGRPAIPDEKKKVRESIYFAPDVHKWLKERAGTREASISSFLNIVVRDRMQKESSK